MLHFALITLLSGDAASDALRSAWQYRRTVSVSGTRSLASLTLPPELSSRAAPALRDLRLLDETGREIPYLLDKTGEREGLVTWRAGVRDIRRETEGDHDGAAIRSQWTIDLGEPRTFTDLGIEAPDVAFAWHVRVETSIDGSGYSVVQADAALFDQVWNRERVRKTGIRFEAPIKARYLRLTARSAPNSRTFELGGASVTLRRRLKADQWSMEVAAVPLPAAEGDDRKNIARYRLEASSLLPFDEVEVVCDDPSFSRRTRLREVVTGASKAAETGLGEGPIFRIRANDAVVAGETVRFPARNGHGGALILEIDNAGSPPLRGVKVRLHGARVRLVFPVSSATLHLRYGNPITRDPAYDLEGLRSRLTQAVDTDAATLGNEELNPAFKREPPLRFAATLGASLDPAAWPRERRLAPLREEDVYSITLKANDLSTLRPDLADLRLVDALNQQVPFLIDRDFTEERVDLKIQKGASPAGAHSVYQLTPAQALSGDHAPVVSRIEIEIKDPFFERRARLLHSQNQGQREVPFSITLAQRPPSLAPQVLEGRAPLEALTLEVDDGDNKALDLRTAVAMVRVPRVVFKAAPGELRLLLGNRDAEAPRYDLAGLRSELLAYSAVTATADTLTENKDARETLLKLFGRTPRGRLVWAAIILAITALVALTLKTLKGA